MIRSVMFCGLVVALASCNGEEKKDEKTELARFQGTWKLVSSEEGGKAFPGEEVAGARFVFEDKKLSIKEPKAKGVETTMGTFSINPSKEPAEIDLKADEKADEPLQSPGIYKFEKDGKLHICFVKGDRARPKTFNTKDTPRAILLVLEKTKE